jgi:hypothetical protein
MEVRKVFWLGKHASLQELGVPLGKVHKAGLAVLLSHGWQQVGCSVMKSLSHR